MLIAERLTSQLLSGPPASDPVTVTRQLLAVQGQDPRGVRLAVRARTSELRVADFNHALSEDRSLVISWLNRGTLHLVTREDFPCLHALTTPPLLAPNARRLAQEGISRDAADRGAELIERALAEEGPLTRAQLRERLDTAGIRTEGQALVHLLMLATLRGGVVRGPMAGAQQSFVLARDWLGQPRPLDHDRALGELARRYLVGHAPAADRDLARWAGLPLRDARAGLRAIATQIVQRADGLLELRGSREPGPLPPPRLLGAFDPVLLGWVSWEFIVGPLHELITTNGVFRPFALVEGRAVARWRIVAGKVEIQPLAELDGAHAEALRADAADVLRYLELA